MEMDTAQIKGVDSTIRKTTVKLNQNASIKVMERLMTHGEQKAESRFVVDLNGENSGANIISRSVAKDNSYQLFQSVLNGNEKCSGHTEMCIRDKDLSELLYVYEKLGKTADREVIMQYIQHWKIAKDFAN